jgi:FMN phosphatase YigB (HAD superfamily)
MKPVLFIDFHNTLSKDYFWRSLHHSHKKKIEELLFVNSNPQTHEWMRGNINSEIINALVAEHIGLDYDLVWKVFVDDCVTMRVSQSELLLINELRKKYYTILITDNMDCFNRYTVPSLQLDTYFDYISNSATEGMLKMDNNGEVFINRIAAFNSLIEKSFLIDDSSSACKIFNRLGGKS